MKSAPGSRHRNRTDIGRAEKNHTKLEKQASLANDHDGIANSVEETRWLIYPAIYQDWF